MNPTFVQFVSFRISFKLKKKMPCNLFILKLEENSSSPFLTKIKQNSSLFFIGQKPWLCCAVCLCFAVLHDVCVCMCVWSLILSLFQRFFVSPLKALIWVWKRKDAPSVYSFFFSFFLCVSVLRFIFHVLILLPAPKQIYSFCLSFFPLSSTLAPPIHSAVLYSPPIHIEDDVHDF
jgi:hypothetical protein